jgi:hypothetical protein
MEPVRELLDVGREHALRFVAAMRDEQHPAYAAIRDL